MLLLKLLCHVSMVIIGVLKEVAQPINLFGLLVFIILANKIFFFLFFFLGLTVLLLFFQTTSNVA